MNSISVQDTFYESEPGILRWKVDRFSGSHGSKLEARSGDVAGCFSNCKRRWIIKINGKTYNRSRIVWELHNGKIPNGMQVDHINLDKMCDSVWNLRLATASQNCCNKNKRSGLTSKYKGVYWDKSKNKWIAGIKINGKRKLLGSFDNEDSAAEAYRNEAKLLHVEFANF